MFSRIGFVALMTLAACSSADDVGGNVTTQPQPTTGPYVSVAVDNHYHDVHPDEPPEISSDRPLVIKNGGSNLHNFSVPSLGIDRDIKPGTQIEFDPIVDTFEVGAHIFFCKYHESDGMMGEFIVTQ